MRSLRTLFGRGGQDLAVDLGTANTVVFRSGDGIVLFEPSVVAIDEGGDEIRAIGEAARRMIGRTPASIRATRPLRHGVIADFEAIGSAFAPETDEEVDVAGRDLMTGLLRRVTLSADDVHRALRRPLGQIIEAVKETLERTPPELAADLGHRGVVLLGGGALLRRLDELIRRETELAVSLAESPLFCVALGAGRSLHELGASGTGRLTHRRRRSSTSPLFRHR